MFYRLPPAGNPVQLESSADYAERMVAWFAPYRAVYVNSGAAALAVALTAVVRRAHKQNAEVLLPAYTCPELVSAVLYAGAKPVLVDLACDRPWMDLDILSTCITQHTVAVVAVSLFGIPERFAQIRQVIDAKGVCLVEDNAQRFPAAGEPVAGDVVIVSFGRGKPVSVLGGGAVLVRDPALAAEIAQAVAGAPTPAGNNLRFTTMARLYNALLSPRLYWLPDSLPFLGLGETRFKPLQPIAPLDAVRSQRLPAGVAAYWRRDRRVQAALAQVMNEFAGRGVTDLAAASCAHTVPRLLRYPLLCASRSLRDELFDRFDRAGLGASRMYPAPLPEIAGLTALLGDQGPFPQAKAFAERILTLPTHEGVRPKDVQQMARVLNAVCG